MLRVPISVDALKFMVAQGEITEVVDGVQKNMEYRGCWYESASKTLYLAFDDGKNEVTDKSVTMKRREPAA